jgi:hypothetical protein
VLVPLVSMLEKSDAMGLVEVELPALDVAEPDVALVLETAPVDAVEEFDDEDEAVDAALPDCICSWISSARISLESVPLLLPESLLSGSSELVDAVPDDEASAQVPLSVADPVDWVASV